MTISNKKEIQMFQIKLLGSSKDVEEYKESLLELFDYDEEATEKSFDKHYVPGYGINISEVVKDAFNKPHIESYNFEIYTLENKDVILTVAYIDK